MTTINRPTAARYTGTASHPLIIRISSVIAHLSTNWPVSEAYSYSLHYGQNGHFGDIPEGGDTLGIVEQLRGLAQVKCSGVTAIYVASHQITISTSAVITREEEVDLLRRAVLQAGVGQPVIS